MRGITEDVDEGHRAFETLAKIAKQMEEQDKQQNAKALTPEKINNLLESIDSCFQYHKSSYVFNIERHSNVKSHCLNFLCSDPKNPQFATSCAEDENESIHGDSCDFCNMVPDICQTLMGLCEQLEEASVDDMKIEEWKHDINDCERAIYKWRNFIARNKLNNQEWSKTLTTDKPEKATCIIDFAMKFEPMRAR